MTVILFSKIRRMYFRDKLSINEIARRTSLSRNTVKRWLRMPGETDPKYKRCPQPTKLTPFEDRLKRALIADSYRPKRERRTVLRLLEELQKAGHDGGYTQLTDYIRAWRQDASSDVGNHAFKVGGFARPQLSGSAHPHCDLRTLKLRPLILPLRKHVNA